MAEKYFSERNLKFLLYEVLDVGRLLPHAFFADHNRESFDLILDTAAKVARDRLYPIFRDMDREPPRLVDGQVKVHPNVGALMQEWGEGGWIGAAFPYETNGQQLPATLSMASNFIFSAANFPAAAYPGLTTGAAHLILSFGSDQLIETYVPSLLEGKWQGTMALTEPQAGSSLSDITTRADPSEEGFYRIHGQKVFISAGDHDGVDNIVHLMLARIKGAPPGVKGISLFVVPKRRPDENGALVSNDINVTAVYHKMGYRGCPITQLSMGENDNCRGYLVGEPHKGLTYMFQMMNEARIGVGLQATAIASAAYYAALEYAKERPQGRKIDNKDMSLPQIPIIEHADVRRMLLFQRAIVEASLSLVLQCGMYVDLIHVTQGEERHKWSLLLDLLTAVVKSYPSEMGILAVSQGLQILGGYGYCDEFPLEQYYRDMRIHPIHEGTTGIQGLDLLGRKVVMENGAAVRLYFEEVSKAVQSGLADQELKAYAEKLQEAMGRLQSVISHLMTYALNGRIERFLADATLFLEFFSLTVMAWQWLLQGLAIRKGQESHPSEADSLFYRGKLITLKYFFDYELPKTLGLAARLTEEEAPSLEMSEQFFSD